MTEMTADSAAKWERRRARGFISFVLLSGVLLSGLPSGIIWGVLFHLISHGKWSDAALGALVVGGAGGLTSGVMNWIRGERRYKRWRLERTA